MIASSLTQEIMSQQLMYFTLWRIITDVMTADTDNWMFINADLSNLLRYFLYSEAVFKKRVTKQ